MAVVVGKGCCGVIWVRVAGGSASWVGGLCCDLEKRMRECIQCRMVGVSVERYERSVVGDVRQAIFERRWMPQS